MSDNIDLPNNNIDLEKIYLEKHLNKQIRDANLHRILTAPPDQGPYGTVLFGNSINYRIVTEDLEKILLEGYESHDLDL